MAICIRALIAAALVAASALVGPALAQTQRLSRTGQPASFELQGKDYVVQGFRSVRFGMTPDQVRAAAAKDFPGAKIGPELRDEASHTTVVSVTARNLSPGPGAALVSYVFGASTGRLIHVNVDWIVNQPTEADRAALTAGGARLVQDFAGYYWKLLTVARGVPIGANGLVLFAGTAEAGGAVEVRLLGVAYTLDAAPGQAATRSPDPTGPAALHLAFAKADADPDTYRIKPGDF